MDCFFLYRSEVGQKASCEDGWGGWERGCLCKCANSGQNAQSLAAYSADSACESLRAKAPVFKEEKIGLLLLKYLSNKDTHTHTHTLLKLQWCQKHNGAAALPPGLTASVISGTASNAPVVQWLMAIICFQVPDSVQVQVQVQGSVSSDGVCTCELPAHIKKHGRRIASEPRSGQQNVRVQLLRQTERVAASPFRICQLSRHSGRLL